VILGLSTPAIGQTTKTAPAAKVKKAQDSKKPAPKVDLNTATVDELQELPGIGPARAAEIVKARPFKVVGDLKAVRGISDKVYDELAPLVMVSEPAKPVASTRREAVATKEVLTKKGMTKKGAAAEAAHEDDPAHQLKKKSALAPGKKININTASAEDLQLLPGIGPVRSAAIIAHRPFDAIEGIMKVEGIKEGIFGQIKDHISVK
jgi:competence protein ComEA